MSTIQKLMRLIVTSQRDLAGRNIYRDLSTRQGFRVRGEFEGKPVYRRGDVWLIATRRSQVRASHLDAFFDPEYYVFASRHRSASGRKTLTVHTPGNLTGEAALGGRAKELAHSQPSAVKTALLELRRIRDERGMDYEVSLEATHHGPTELRRPVLFVEVGSTPREWGDPKAVEAVAEAALAAAQSRESHDAGIGIGGNHYAPLHTRAVLETEIALGHIIPGYAIDSLDVDVFREAVDKSGASFGYMDWKGMKKAQREKIVSMAGEIGLPLMRGRDLRKRGAAEGYRVDRALMAEAWKADAQALEARLSRIGCRYTKSRGAIDCVLPEDRRRDVVEACLRVLGAKGALRWIGGELRWTVERFSPEKARQQGIPPGPLYGRLAAGEKVSVEGREIHPEMVHQKVTRRIRIRDAYTAEILRRLLQR